MPDLNMDPERELGEIFQKIHQESRKISKAINYIRIFTK
jgi:hypothetical protein